MNEPFSRSSHFAFLDGIRGLAALYVLLHHVWLTAYPRSGTAQSCNICLDSSGWTDWMRWGQLAVVVFIVVSGFSLALTPIRNSYRLPDGFWAYMQRRALRIIPPYWAALIFSCLLVALLTGEHTGKSVNVKAVVVHALLVQNVLDSPKPNGAFWSIAVEWQIYFVFPILLLLCRRLGPWAMALFTLATTILAYLAGTQYETLAGALGFQPHQLALLVKLLHLSPQFLALFAFGVVGMHVAVGRSATEIPWLGIGAGLSVATVILLWIMPTEVIEPNYFWVDLFAGATAAVLLAGFVRRPTSIVPNMLSGKYPRWLGQSSYSLYLIHVPILDLASIAPMPSFVSGSDGRFAWLLFLAVPSAILASRLFCKVFELPFMNHRSIHKTIAATSLQSRAIV